MKRKILVSVPSLVSGGVEVSMIRFLNVLASDKNNDIVLLMLRKEGMYLKDVPSNVKIIEVLYDNDLYSFNNKFSDIKKINNVKDKFKFFFYRLKLKNKLKHNDWDSYYKIILEHVIDVEGEYDLAIDWHGYGHFMTTIIAEKVRAKNKVMWIHDEKNEWISKVDSWLGCFNKIFCVGISCLNNISKNNKKLKDKLDVFYNMTDYLNVREKSKEKVDFSFNKNKLNIVTVGRLEWQKAYDIAIDIASKLKEKNVDFCWYAIGGGTQKEKLAEMVKDRSLEDRFKFLGIISNPFPYVKNADMYVLCSRHEGYCLATLEAKILGKVIIATDIDSNKEQIKDGENGFLCKLDSEEFANKIIEVYNDKRLMKRVEANLLKENFDYTSEFKKLYEMIDK